jgi:hypothetical protein
MMASLLCFYYLILKFIFVNPGANMPGISPITFINNGFAFVYKQLLSSYRFSQYKYIGSLINAFVKVNFYLISPVNFTLVF